MTIQLHAAFEDSRTTTSFSPTGFAATTNAPMSQAAVQSFKAQTHI